MRLGIRRDRPPIGPGAVAIATAEARVVEREIDRRLGTVTLDLRIDGDAIGPWQPFAHAAWPGDVDHVIAVGEFWDDSLPPLTALFGRTIDPVAADVRRRMLHHLGVLPIDHLDDNDLDAWPTGTLRPTDLWLMAMSADRVESTDPSVLAMTAEPADEATSALDAAFDRLARHLLAADTMETPERRLQRALADAATADISAAEARDQLLRAERESADLIDELRARLAVVDETAERAELQRTIEAGPA